MITDFFFFSPASEGSGSDAVHSGIGQVALGLAKVECWHLPSNCTALPRPAIYSEFQNCTLKDYKDTPGILITIQWQDCFSCQCPESVRVQLKNKYWRKPNKDITYYNGPLAKRNTKLIKDKAHAKRHITANVGLNQYQQAFPSMNRRPRKPTRDVYNQINMSNESCILLL